MLRLLLGLAMTAASSLPVARGEGGGPTIEAGSLRVTLDAMLPRPLYVVLADGTNFSARVAPPVTLVTKTTLPASCASNDTAPNVGCWGAGDGGPVADKTVWGTGKNVPKASSAEECCALCANHSKCAAWTWNGPKGNLYCYGCKSVPLHALEVFAFAFRSS